MKTNPEDAKKKKMKIDRKLQCKDYKYTLIIVSNILISNNCFSCGWDTLQSKPSDGHPEEDRSIAEQNDKTVHRN